MGCKKLLVWALVLAFALVAGPVRADSPSGTISFQVNSLTGAADMGISWVDGTLSFQGKTYSFKMKGLRTARPGVRDFVGTGGV